MLITCSLLCFFFSPHLYYTALQRGTTAWRGGISSTSCLNKCLGAFQPIEASTAVSRHCIFMQV